MSKRKLPPYSVIIAAAAYLFPVLLVILVTRNRFAFYSEQCWAAFSSGLWSAG